MDAPDSGGSLASLGGGGAPPPAPAPSGGASVLSSLAAPRLDVPCEELELFHDCGCPKER